MALAADSTDQKHSMQRARQAYYDRISDHNMAPAWEKLQQLIGSEPKTECVPAIWRFRDAKTLVLESAELISAK
jgi:gentisate 1,2-dioxygenase